MYLTYIRRELRRRSKQAIVVAVGLAIGIGLVMTVSATSTGVENAQLQVLHSLYGVGTDMTVTKTASAGSGGPQHFSGFGGNAESAPAAGTQISRNTLRPTPGSATLPAADVSKVASLSGAAAATGGLVLTDTSFSGTISSATSGAGTGATRSTGAGSSFDISSFSVDGVQISKSGVGPLDAAEVAKGSYFSSSDNTAMVAIVSSSYAGQQSLSVGSTVTVAGDSLSVIGIARMPSGSADVYIPLGTAQSLAGLSGDVTTIYVSATSAANVSSLAAEVQRTVPGATVSTSAQLASEVTGSLSSATSLATRLGKWLSIAALAVAFVIAGLLMMAAVSRRVREFGTLKAIGWRTRRIVAQVMGEGLALGLVGGVAGIVLGLAGSEIVSLLAPSLSATVGSSFATGGGDFGAFGGGGSAGATSSSPAGGGLARAFDSARTVLVHLSAPVQSQTILVAVCLAVAGGLVAGALGSWRASRLRPAAALRRIE